MMKKQKNAIIAAAFMTLAASSAWAGDKSRACTPKDLAGIWEMKSMTGETKKVNPSDPFLSPYQRFRFTADGKMTHMVARRPIAGDPTLESLIENTLLLSTYNLDPKGVLTVFKIESSNPEKCLCTYLLADPPAEKLAQLPPEKRAMVPTKGDVMLTYLSADGRTLVGKTLKKIK